jgi:hypothetical protein
MNEKRGSEKSSAYKKLFDLVKILRKVKDDIYKLSLPVGV